MGTSHGKGPDVPNKFLNFVMKELANTKILGNTDENCQVIFTNIEEELQDKILPCLENVLLKTHQLKSWIEAKQEGEDKASLLSLGISN